jgi:hypothetical protein
MFLVPNYFLLSRTRGNEYMGENLLNLQEAREVLVKLQQDFESGIGIDPYIQKVFSLFPVQNFSLSKYGTPEGRSGLFFGKKCGYFLGIEYTSQSEERPLYLIIGANNEVEHSWIYENEGDIDKGNDLLKGLGKLCKNICEDVINDSGLREKLEFILAAKELEKQLEAECSYIKPFLPLMLVSDQPTHENKMVALSHERERIHCYFQKRISADWIKRNIHLDDQGFPQLKENPEPFFNDKKEELHGFSNPKLVYADLCRLSEGGHITHIVRKGVPSAKIYLDYAVERDEDGKPVNWLILDLNAAEEQPEPTVVGEIVIDDSIPADREVRRVGSLRVNLDNFDSVQDLPETQLGTQLRNALTRLRTTDFKKAVLANQATIQARRDGYVKS